MPWLVQMGQVYSYAMVSTNGIGLQLCHGQVYNYAMVSTNGIGF